MTTGWRRCNQPVALARKVDRARSRELVPTFASMVNRRKGKGNRRDSPNASGQTPEARSVPDPRRLGNSQWNSWAGGRERSRQSQTPSAHRHRHPLLILVTQLRGVIPVGHCAPSSAKARTLRQNTRAGSSATLARYEVSHTTPGLAVPFPLGERLQGTAAIQIQFRRPKQRLFSTRSDRNAILPHPQPNRHSRASFRRRRPNRSCRRRARQAS